jgi:NDP-sugar pyrophosphorylase family protein
MKVVIMAGGEGRRLRPLTEEVPKPMLPLGEKPLLHILIERLKASGLKDIIITTRYKSEIIKGYFQDGKILGVNIFYTHETKKLGTAGPLTLLKNVLKSPFLVVNGDIFTNFDFRKIIEFHKKTNSEATVGVVNWKFQIPFGVINTFNGYIKNIEEKPSLNFLILAGIYVFNPSVLDKIPTETTYNINQLLSELIKDGKEPKYFEIKDNWIDIGRLPDYEYACENFQKLLE